MSDNQEEDVTPEADENEAADTAAPEADVAKEGDVAGAEGDEATTPEAPDATGESESNGTGNGSEAAEKVNGTNRRRVLIGAGVGVAAVAAAAYGASKLIEPPIATQIQSRLISGEIPLNDPTSKIWAQAPVARIEMDAQVMSLPTKPVPSVKDIRVRSLNNGDTVGFLLEWADPQDNDSTIKTDGFRDACAVLFVPDPNLDILRVMGAGGPLAGTIIQWKADWQVDVAKGFQDVEAAWPNASFDFYPPIIQDHDSPKHIVAPDDYEKARATYRIAGYAANNPVALMNRKTPVEKLIGQGPGTLADFDTQDATGWGVWRNGKWLVALGKSMKGTNEGEVSVPPGGEVGVSFAVWRGDQQDRGARKTPSKQLIRLMVAGG